MNAVDNAISTMDSKYGIGNGMKALNQFLKTGDDHLITRTNGARDEILKFSRDEIDKYLKSMNKVEQGK
jgi:uncharacterized protein (UPF0297 family)